MSETRMALSALLIADYLIGISPSKSGLTVMQVNKLAYIAHGFTLAIEDQPLFRDRVEAWKYGPIVPSLYHALKDFGGNNINILPYCDTRLDAPHLDDRLAFTTSRLPQKHKAIIDRVMAVYGGFSGPGLSTITHEKGTPWDQCYREGELGIQIPDHITQEYYKRQLVSAT